MFQRNSGSSSVIQNGESNATTKQDKAIVRETNPFSADGAAKSASRPAWLGSNVSIPKKLSISMESYDPRVDKNS
jgi:hypothetical protein